MRSKLVKELCQDKLLVLSEYKIKILTRDATISLDVATQLLGVCDLLDSDEDWIDVSVRDLYYIK